MSIHARGLKIGLSMAFMLASTTGCGDFLAQVLGTSIPKPSASPSASPGTQNNNNSSSNAGNRPGATPVNNGKLSFDTPKLSMRLNEEQSLRDYLKSDGGEVPQGIRWNSSNTNAVTVNSNTGQVKAVGTGKVFITATGPNGARAELEINAEAGLAASTVKVIPATAVLALQEKTQLRAEVHLVSGEINSNVTWSSSDETVASVNHTNGEVVAHKEGTITIVATYNSDGQVKGVSTLQIVKDKANLTPTPKATAITFGPGGTTGASTNPLFPAPVAGTETGTAAPAPTVQLGGTIYNIDKNTVYKLDVATKTKTILVNENSFLGTIPNALTRLVYDRGSTLYFGDEVTEPGAKTLYSLALNTKQVVKVYPPQVAPGTQVFARVIGFFNSKLHILQRDQTNNKTFFTDLFNSEPKVFPFSEGTWSITGRFATRSGDSLYIANADASVQTELLNLKTLDMNGDCGYSWNNAGDRLAVCTSDGSGSRHLYTVGIDGSIKKLKVFKENELNQGGHPDGARWSVGDQYIAYTSNGGQLQVIDAANGGNPIATGVTLSGGHSNMIWVN